MKKEIWKFKLLPVTNQTLEMPAGAEILTVQTQKDEPHLWALVNPKEDKDFRSFEIFGTGFPIYYDMGTERKYIGTYQLDSGSLVFHVFEHTGI